MYKFFIGLVFVTLLFGCTSTPNIKSDYNLDSNSSKGIMLASISYVGGYSGYAVSLSDSSKTENWTIQFGEGMALIPIPPKGDYSSYGKKGELFAIELPSGEYQIDEWNVFSGYATISPVTPISIEFKIEPGKATYIGNFNFTQTDSLGLTVTGVEVTYSDNFEEDSVVLGMKFPNINTNNILMGISPNTSLRGFGGGGNASWETPVVVLPQT